MKSIRTLYKIGNGPSSSHTMGPKKAALYILNKYPHADMIEVVLYGSLAATGVGHLTQVIIGKVFNAQNYAIYTDSTEKKHPNTMTFRVFYQNELIGEEEIYSIGGGSIAIKGEAIIDEPEVYLENNYEDIKKYCFEHNCTLLDYIMAHEDSRIVDYMEHCYQVMMRNVKSGLQKQGMLPGSLRVKRKAQSIYMKKEEHEPPTRKEKRLLSAYAFAASEENASGEEVVTAPTCGASGVMPAVIHYLEDIGNDHQEIIKGMLVAGLIGNLVKQNASISGAECGCQAEIGTACAMGAVLASYLLGADIHQIEQSAEIALEHHLGLTCDPVEGYVQIPCIERNAVAALRAIEVAMLNDFLDYHNQKITLDTVITTMLETGKDLNNRYKETSQGGLAKTYHHNC